MKLQLVTRIFLLCGIFLSLIMPHTAAEAQSDQRCFTREKCTQIRTGLGAPDPANGFVVQNSCGTTPEGIEGVQAGQSMGYCLPAAKTVTQIGLGNKREFTDIGDYIKTMYQWGIGMAGVLAVIVIITAGFQWMSSGGNSQIISSAQKRIFGAIVGLIIAVGSYTILNLINPALVNLRLPQTWLVNEIQIGASECKLLNNVGNVSLALNQQELLLLSTAEADAKKRERGQNKKFDIPKEQALCGASYFYEPNSNLTCTGNLCGVNTKQDGKTCAPISTKNGKIVNTPSCIPGQLVLRFSVNSLQQNLISSAGETIGQSAGTVGVAVLEPGSEWFAGNWNKMEPNSLAPASTVLFPVCWNNRNTQYYIATGEEWQHGETKGRKEFTMTSYDVGSTFPDIIVQLNGIADVTWASRCNKNDEFKGIMVKTEIGFAGDDGEGFLYLGYDGNNNAIGGSWDQYLNQTYIPLKKIEEGLFLNVSVTDDMISEIRADLDTEGPAVYDLANTNFRASYLNDNTSYDYNKGYLWPDGQYDYR